MTTIVKTSGPRVNTSGPTSGNIGGRLMQVAPQHPTLSRRFAQLQKIKNVARVMGALKDMPAQHRFGRQFELFQDGSLQRLRAVVERQLDVGKAQHAPI